MKTYQPKGEVKREWHLMDAKDEVLGRISSEIAKLLMGKHKVTFSRHMDSGDNVVVVNADKFVVTGKKAVQKVYRSHSGYPGGFKEKKFEKVMELHPERILKNAISGMLPDNHLKAKRLARLKIVMGAENPYSDKFNK